MFGDVNVKVEDGNLGRSSSTGTGTSIKIGISNVESKSPILISGTMNAKKIKENTEEMTVSLDTGQVVGAIAPDMYDALGRIRTQKGRGN